jgi:S1-C subfamily serine protease
MKKTSNISTSKIFLVSLSFLFATACASPPIKKEDIRVRYSSEKIGALGDTQLIIHMRPEDRKSTYPIRASLTRQIAGYLEEGLLIESAAIKTFSKVFKKVRSSEHSKAANLVITVSGVSDIELMNGIYTAEASAIVALASGKKLGKYEATGKATHIKVNDKNVFELAYVKAFVKILEAMLKDDRLAKYFDNGFGKLETANLSSQSTVTSSNTHSPPTPNNHSPHINSIESSSNSRPSLYSGSGFLFGSKDYVITNYHVVRGLKSIKVKFLSGEIIQATVASVDENNDVAFLKLAKSPQMPSSNVRIGDSSTVKLGDKIFTIGYPATNILGVSPKYSEGVVNSIKGLKDNPAFFQISVPIQPGNSGGPLFNEKGEVIGITTSSLDAGLARDAMGAAPQNINYAVKSAFIRNLMPTIPDIMLANRGIVVVPNGPENSLSSFIDKVKRNVVLIEGKE